MMDILTVIFFLIVFLWWDLLVIAGFIVALRFGLRAVGLGFKALNYWERESFLWK